jgi:hypothetical protein
VALLVAVSAAAAQGVTVDWSRTAVSSSRTLPGEGPEGATALQLQATAPGGTSFHLVTIDDPHITGPAYVVTGQVRYEGVEGQGYLEMWSVLPGGERFFTRTLATDGPLAALHGDSKWRRFELSFDLGGAQAPRSLEINLVLPGRGTVWLGPLSLERHVPGSENAQGAWWSQRSGILFGVVLGSLVGILGGTIGALAGRGKGRRLVLGLLTAMVGIGGPLALVGVAALLTSQPRYVWYPPLLLGGVSTVLGLLLRRVVKLRYAADELRRIQAMDAGRA